MFKIELPLFMKSGLGFNIQQVPYSVRPKGFFSFRPKPKLAEIAIFLFGRNRYRNRKKTSISAETESRNRNEYP